MGITPNVFTECTIKPWVGRNYEDAEYYSGKLLIITNSHYNPDQPNEYDFNPDPLFNCTEVTKAKNVDVPSTFFYRLYLLYRRYHNNSARLTNTEFWDSVVHYNIIHQLTCKNGSQNVPTKYYNESVIVALKEVIKRSSPKYIAFHTPIGWSKICRVGPLKGIGRDMVSWGNNLYKLNFLSHPHLVTSMYHPSARILFHHALERKVMVTNEVFVEVCGEHTSTLFNTTLV